MILYRKICCGCTSGCAANRPALVSAPRNDGDRGKACAGRPSPAVGRRQQARPQPNAAARSGAANTSSRHGPALPRGWRAPMRWRPGETSQRPALVSQPPRRDGPPGSTPGVPFRPADSRSSLDVIFLSLNRHWVKRRDDPVARRHPGSALPHTPPTAPPRIGREVEQMHSHIGTNPVPETRKTAISSITIAVKKTYTRFCRKWRSHDAIHLCRLLAFDLHFCTFRLPMNR